MMLTIYLIVEWKFEKRNELELILKNLILLVGLTADISFCFFGITHFPTSELLLPWWLMVVWLSFAFTFNGCYRWLCDYPIWLSAILGAVFGPIVYWLASQLAPFMILKPLAFTVASSLFWGTLYASGIFILKKINPSEQN